MEELLEKISSGKAVVGIVGLGYVGLPAAMLTAEKFKVVGYDIDLKRIRRLVQGGSPVDGVPPAKVASVLDKAFFPTSRESDMDICDIFVICVPTPLGPRNEPDLSALVDASLLVTRHLRPGTLVILESTTYPGTTESVLVPILEQTGMTVGVEFYVAYSPERIDPGRTDLHLASIPKVVGGFDENSTAVASRFLGMLFEAVVPVKDCRTAEATKMLENVFRAVNIALVNELTLALEKMDIDIWDVIRAASTKPYGFMAFWPGPGIGGHCIPLDPYYFSYAAKRVGILTRFIELSGDVNAFMPYHVLHLLEAALRSAGKSLRGARIAILGLSYKRDVSDTRESPSAKVIDEILRRGATIEVYDPLAKEISTSNGSFRSTTSAELALKDSDAALLLVDHTLFKGIPETIFQRVMKPIPVVVDCRNFFASPLPGTVFVGLGKPGTASPDRPRIPVP